MIDKYCIILSLDAVGKDDFAFIKNLPNFKYLIENGSYSFNVKSIYPTLTYPAHTTIVTGKYPKNHGITNNFLIQPNKKNCDWFWFRKNIKSETFYDLAKKHAFTTASILWPVTAKANIDFNMPEILPHKSWHNQVLVSLLNGSKFFQFDMNRRFGYMRNGIKQPNLDNFSMATTLHLLKHKKPNLTLVHLTDVDSQKHKFGIKSKEVEQSLLRHDYRLGQLLRLLREEEILEKTNIVVLGDHSAKNVSKVVKLNKLFLKENLLQKNNDNTISNWKVYMNTCDGSAYIYINKNTSDKDLLKKQVENLILKFSTENGNFIKTLFSSKEASNLGADPNCDFMIEGNDGFYFLNDLEGEVIQNVSEKYDKATHGYSPNKNNYETFFIAIGPNIKQNFNIGPMNLVDEAPTISKILNFEFKGTDGNSLNQIFK